MQPSDWLERALCRGVPHLFYDEEHPEEALAICARCPVRAECLAEAHHFERGVAAQGRFGIWGGLLPAERYAIEKAPPPPPPRTCDRCGRPHVARGLCGTCYKRRQRAGMPSLAPVLT